MGAMGSGMILLGDGRLLGPAERPGDARRGGPAGRVDPGDGRVEGRGDVPPASLPGLSRRRSRWP